MNQTKRQCVWLTAAAPVLTLGLLALWTCFVWQGLQTMDQPPADSGFFLPAMVLIAAVLTAGSVWSLVTQAHVLGFLCAACILMAVGAGYQTICGGVRSWFLFLIAGVAVGSFLFCFWRNRNQLDIRLYALLLALMAALMAGNLFFGEERYGAKLWIRVGPVSFQPGELLKILVILLGAVSYRNLRRSLIFCTAALAVSGELVYLNDLGGAVIVFLIFVWMTYILFDNRLLSLGIIAAALVLFYLSVKAAGHARLRLENWLHIMELPAGSQQRQTLVAAIFGGFGGLGFADAHIMTGIFSAQSDAALAGVMAVFGHPVLLLTMGAYALLILQSAFHSSVYPSNYLILAQTSLYLFLHPMENFCGALDLLPFTGVTSPLVSAGGTSMVSCCALLGLCLASLDPKLKRRESV